MGWVRGAAWAAGAATSVVCTAGLAAAADGLVVEPREVAAYAIGLAFAVPTAMAAWLGMYRETGGGHGV